MLRFLTLALAAYCYVQPGLALAQDAKQLVGTWKLASWQVQYVGEEAREPFGPNPKGRLIVAPDGYWSVIIAKANRKPATNNAERAALLRSMVAYTGRFTVEGDKITSPVDISWNEVNTGRNQTRFFKMEGEKLVIQMPEAGERAQSGQAGQEHADLGTGALSVGGGRGFWRASFLLGPVAGPLPHGRDQRHPPTRVRSSCRSTLIYALPAGGRL